MPLALDLISAFESGWILPVATTTRARSPFSTVASLEGSISWFGLSAALTPRPAPSRTTSATEPQRILRRRFFPFFPFPANPFVLLDISRPPRFHGFHSSRYGPRLRKVPYLSLALDDRPEEKSGRVIDTDRPSRTSKFAFGVIFRSTRERDRDLYQLPKTSSLRAMVVTLAAETDLFPGRSLVQRESDYEEAPSCPARARARVIRLPFDEPPADHYCPSRKICDLQVGRGNIASRVGEWRQISVGHSHRVRTFGCL